jgi:peptide chain release factor 3
VARWVRSKDPALLKKLIETHRSSMADDQDNVPVLLMRNAWEFGRFQQDWPEINFSAVRERS